MNIFYAYAIFISIVFQNELLKVEEGALVRNMLPDLQWSVISGRT